MDTYKSNLIQVDDNNDRIHKQLLDETKEIKSYIKFMYWTLLISLLFTAIIIIVAIIKIFIGIFR